MPTHHNLDRYLEEYIAAAGIAAERKEPLFRTLRGRFERADRQFPASIGCVEDDSLGELPRMQVASGPVGRQHVHFEAPVAKRRNQEMQIFLDWFNEANEKDWVVKASLAHLWFVTIHPFDDGNGRIARAIADMGLARSERSSQRFYSMSAQIQQERRAYYDHLEQAQRGTMDITNWMAWFLDCLGHAIEGAQTTLATVLVKARFWESISQPFPSMSARGWCSIAFWTDLREDSLRQSGRSWRSAHRTRPLAISLPWSTKVY